MATPVEIRKVLAIAVMRDGKVVNKLIPGTQTVQVGTGYNNNIVMEGTNLPGTMNFICPGEEKGTWVIRLSGEMDATVTSTDGALLNFRDLKGLGVFPTDDDGFYLLNLKYGDQGQVRIGAFVIHFGFIDPPKAPHRAAPQKKKPPTVKARKPVPETKVDDTRTLKIIIEVPGEKKVELFPSAGIMTVGEAEYNTVCVKGVSLPRIHTLLEPHNGGYILNLLQEIKGGVEVKGSIIPFATLIERKLLRQEKPGEPYIWIFDKNVSGVFTIGSTEVFFGFAEPPAKAERKPEPKVILRQKFVPSEYKWSAFAGRPHDEVVFRDNRRENGRFQLLLGFGLSAALLLGAVCDRVIVVTNESKAQLLRRAPSARVATLSETTPQAEGIGEEVISDLPAEVVSAGTGGGGPAGGGEGPSAGVAAGVAAADDILQSIGFAAYGTSSSGGGAGFVGDLQTAASSGLGLASGQMGEGLLAGGGGGGSGGITGLVGAGGGVAGTAETVSTSEMEAVHQAAQVTFSASASGEALDLGHRNMSAIRSKINVIKMRVQTAYESLLRMNPTAGGTIYINFSITPGGSVVNLSVSAPGELASLRATVQSAVSSLNFGSSPEQTTNLDVSVPFNLIPPQ